ncbi:MAG TPA: Dabb family protein [Verrucomicrobiae bacterium]|nr:Dabb family protein [Verrucomicrobiae bacterium]
MKFFLPILVALLSSGLLLSVVAQDAAQPKKAKAGKKAGKTKAGKLHHVVSFKFKSSATADQIKQVVEAFEALKTKIPQIASLKWGTNVSPEKHDKGFTHMWVLTFNSQQARDEYLVHPAHKEFGQMLGPILDDVFVIDFWAQN